MNDLVMICDDVRPTRKDYNQPNHQITNNNPTIIHSASNSHTPRGAPAYHTHMQAHARVGALHGKGDLDASLGGFPWGIPQKWIVYNGTSHQKG